MAPTASPTPRNEPVWLWWTGGKDSAWALRLLRNDPKWEVRGLVTQVNRPNGRVAMHGVRRQMVERQAAAVGLPLDVIAFDWAAAENHHEAAIEEGLLHLCQGNNGKFIAFSELLPGRAMKRRTALLSRIGLHPVFPLWGRDPADHATELLRAGVKAWVCSVETDRLPAECAGCRFDEDFVAALPRGVDPCGEDGEFTRSSNGRRDGRRGFRRSVAAGSNATASGSRRWKSRLESHGLKSLAPETAVRTKIAKRLVDSLPPTTPSTTTPGCGGFGNTSITISTNLWTCTRWHPSRP